MQSWNMYFVSSSVLIYVTILGVSAELRAVVQFFRHGERTPLNFYANDPYQDPLYWGGLDEGQLTNEGKRQHLVLGQYTRNRYWNFLPEKYHRSLVHIQTTDVDRTHMSAQSNIYGIFPAKYDQIWLQDVNWQPIPIHPADEYILISSWPQSCKAYDTHLENVLKSAEYQAIDKKYSSVYSYLTKCSGENVSDLRSAVSIYDTLKIEELVGYILPSWTEYVYPEPLYTLAGVAFELTTHTTEMKRLFTGPLLNEIVEYLQGMARNSSFSQKFRMYSCHDENIAALLNSFGAFDPPYPPKFAESIYIELHVGDRKYHVKVFSKSGDTVKEISVNGCNFFCPLTEFRKRLDDIIVDVATRDAECNAPVRAKGFE